MEELLDKLKKKLQNVLKKELIIVDEVTYIEQKHANFLTVVLDKIGGLEIEEIIKASQIVNEIVLKFELKSDFILDVISKERG
ncbi:MAG: hypothetical protein E7172_05715 [Firmicutes bacterium]|nr:hypothetical protein [Bacillota bacterium]